LVRHQVLLQNKLMENNKIKNDNKAAIWIGEKSFEYSNKTQTFGKIHTLSPCFLIRKGENDSTTKFLPYHQSYAQKLLKLETNYYFPEFNPKTYYTDVWKSIDDSETIPNESNKIYQEVTKPGVDKNYEGQSEEDDKAFFKQVWLKMQKDFAFGFYVKLSSDVNFKTAHVTFGKESSPFLMEVVEMEEELFKKEDESTALMLTSDTYVAEDIIGLAEFAVTETVPFRNIVSPTSSKTDYYRIDKNHNPANNRKSRVRLLLLKRGSVFYCKNGNLNEIKKRIDTHQNFKNIGYNHYQLLNLKY